MFNKKVLLVLTSVIVLFSIIYAGVVVNKPNMKPEDKPLHFNSSKDFKKEWASVDSLDDKGLPKSALELVDKIYKKAFAENNAEQVIKARIYQLKYRNAIEEDAFENILNDLIKDAKIMKFPYGPVYHSIASEMYWMYYQNNRWKFNQRSETANFQNDDIKTWDLNKLADACIKHYMLSLENEDSLKRTPISEIKAVIDLGQGTDGLRPTLYDFLAFRAINFFSNKEIALSKPADYFELKEDFYFSDASEFMNLKIKTADTLSLQFYGIKVIQKLLQFHANDAKPEAFIDADLTRLKFIYSNSVNTEKDELYLNALKKLQNKYNSNAFSTEVAYQVALTLNSLSSNYIAQDSLTIKFKDYKIQSIAICNKAIEQFPNSTGAAKCKNLKSQIENKTLAFNIEQVQIPGKPFVTKISYQNISKVWVRVSEIDMDEYERLSQNFYGADFVEKLLKTATQVKNFEVNLPYELDYNDHTTELVLDSLKYGHYVIFISQNQEFKFDDDQLAYKDFMVSDISYIYRRCKDGDYDVFVTNRSNGKPLNEVSVQEFYSKYNYVTRKYNNVKGKTHITDENGYVKVLTEYEKDVYNTGLEFKWNKQTLKTQQNFYNYRYNNEIQKAYSTIIFTDRAIYRPGQTIYYKGIVVEIDSTQRSIAKKFATTLSFIDPNYQTINQTALTTNDFGTFSGTLQIPQGLLNGNFQLSTPDGSISVSVEEYKRPKFEAELNPFKGNYRLNDTVEVSGKGAAYSGANISDADVTYRVVRTPIWRGWWWRPTRQTSVEITNGKIKTDDKGEFKFKFKAIPDLSIKADDYTDFDYQVSIDITDINGETQSDSKSITVGYTTLLLDVNVPATLNSSEEKKYYIYSTNLNGEKVPASGKITISKLEDEKEVLRNRLWEKPEKFNYTKEEWETKYPGNVYDVEADLSKLKTIKQVFSYGFDTGKEEKFEIKDLIKWDPGRYVIEMNSIDSFGKKVMNKKYITVFGEKSIKLPYANPFWHSAVKNYCEPGEIAKFVVGSTYENVFVLYEIEHRHKIVFRKWIPVSNNQILIEIPVKEEYRGNFSVHFKLVANNRVYSYDETVSVPYSNKQLKISFETFRDKLLPGQQEEWRLKITGPKGEKVAAEMVAALYDKSLDALKANYWGFNVFPYDYMNMYLSSDLFSTYTSNQIVKNYKNYPAIPYQKYDALNWFGFYFYGNRNYNGYGREGVSRSKKYASAVMSQTPDAAPSEAMAGEMDEFEKKGDVSGGKITLEESNLISKDKLKGEAGIVQDAEGQLGNVKARTNLNETAFFYPTLMTNENGEVIVKFTVPEALTSWKMMGFAHTQNLEYGFVNNELVTQKELMVVPNLPRFFRENDKIELSVKISNLSEKELKGQAKMELTDPVTMKTIVGILSKNDEIKSFSVDKKGNANVIWNLSIPEGINAVSVKVVATAENFSDGEQSVIPVMSNRMMVTESMPLPIRGNSSKIFEFKKLLESGSSSTLKSFKYTLEFTSNPAWYAVQALPYLIEYPYECNEQTFSRYYANSLATHIANSSPKIKAVFDSWKNTPDSKALLSNLEKNQELKSVLLQETPWVLDAQDETQRKRNIGLLFDLNRMSNEMQVALTKLEKSQSANGGWPWFPGMPENRYITQHMITGFGHLQKLKVIDYSNDKDLKKMVESGVNYLDKRIKDDYNDLLKYYTKEELLKKHIGSTQEQYLYARSFFTEIPIPNNCNTAFGYFKGQAEKYWLTENKYLQGMMALGLHRYQSKKVPLDIIKSLRENSITNDELGMYWKDVEAGYYWYNAPIETQALLIEAFDEVANDQKSVEEMKIWLLKQKQTQDWKTTKATVEAIYSLLLKGTDLLANDQLVEIVIGTQKIDPKKMDDVKVEAGTGYFKTSWQGTDVKPEMGKVTVTKNTEGIAWGSVYWQYFEQLDKITPHETPLKLKKELFVERLTSSGKIIEPIKAPAILKVGDKVIVRIELRVDRTMEFVHMKDMRASGFEPLNVFSVYKYQDGLGYYESTKDASTNFFMDNLPKGTYVFEYPLRVSQKGDFSNGITTIQCMYAPEFSSHSQGERVKVE
jgi:hypothetical protein